MQETDGIKVVSLQQRDSRLGRHVVHDERSRGFALVGDIDRSGWHDKAIHVYDPKKNPNQEVGCCTGVAKCIQFNAVGNRHKGVILDMDDALTIYALNTVLDVFDGTFTYPPIGGDDTGSSGLASCKSAQQLGLGGEYFWEFRGADGVVQQIMAGNVVSVGTRWDYNMFHKDVDGVIHPGGGMAGGHQYVLRGYDKDRDLVLGRCWWGSFKDFWIARGDLDSLLRDNGDAHVQRRA